MTREESVGRSQKIAITIPKTLFREAEKARKEKGESRSAFIQRAIRTFLQMRKEREAVRRYVEGYRQLPETQQEIKAAEQAAMEILTEEPWQ